MNTITNARKLTLVRTKDISGVSGIGTVAEGIEFTDGTVVIKWLSHMTSMGIFPNVKELLLIHGHEGSTKVVFEDGNDNLHNT